MATKRGKKPVASSRKKPSIFVIDDEDDRGFRTTVAETLPGTTVSEFTDALSAFKSTSRPDAILIDLSAVGSIIQGPDHFYSPICSLLGKFPGATVIINSAVSRDFAQCVLDDVLERCPDSDVRLVDWSKCEPDESLRQILREVFP